MKCVIDNRFPSLPPDMADDPAQLLPKSIHFQDCAQNAEQDSEDNFQLMQDIRDRVPRDFTTVWEAF